MVINFIYLVNFLIDTVIKCPGKFIDKTLAPAQRANRKPLFGVSSLLTFIKANVSRDPCSMEAQILGEDVVCMIKSMLYNKSLS